jgi:predicted DNA-binding protein with PD1-like motif
MKSIKRHMGRVIVGKLFPDEDLIDGITEIVIKYDINAGHVNVIGALKKFTLGFFNIENNEYDFTTFEENVELISCMGNIAHINTGPIIHLHVSLGRADYSILAGHLSQPSIISITGEVYIHEIDEKLKRSVDPQFGLSLLDL